MKKIALLLLAAFTLQCAGAQIFQSPYKRNIKRAEKKAGEALKGGADFVIDPIEQVPEKKIASRRIALSAVTNWGKDYLLPDALRTRLENECKSPVLVKIADTGNPDHTALRQGQQAAKNYTTDADAGDGNGHSTHVAGIMCADGFGILDALVDKGLVKWKAVKILSNGGSGSFDWVKNAYAAERAEDAAFLASGGFVVYNGSFGGGTQIIQTVEDEIKKSTDLGIVFCFAAGNTGQTGVNYPGCGKYSIACGSLDQGLGRSSYSTMGAEVWASMPGRGINSTYKGQAYAVLSGTSMATPFLTAATAVAYSKWGAKLKGLERLRPYLAWCAKDLGAPGKDNEYGWGIELIQNILDRDPKDTPGLPNDPPPPPPPGDGLKSVTPLTVALAKEFNVLWDNVSASAGKTAASTVKVAGRGARRANQGLALKAVKVRLEARLESQADAATEAARLDKAVTAYLTNRGFLLPQGQDESWAAVWAAYFVEMGLSQQSPKFKVTVTQVSHVSGGQQVTTKDPLLKHWQGN